MDDSETVEVKVGLSIMTHKIIIGITITIVNKSYLANASLKRLLEARVTPPPLLTSTFSTSFVLQNHHHQHHCHCHHHRCHHHHHYPSLSPPTQVDRQG